MTLLERKNCQLKNINLTFAAGRHKKSGKRTLLHAHPVKRSEEEKLDDARKGPEWKGSLKRRQPVALP